MKFKKVFTALLTVLIILSGTITSFASDNITEPHQDILGYTQSRENVGLTEVDPRLRGAVEPTSSAGTSYSFSGSAIWPNKLFTSKYVTGCTKYEVTVKNNKNYDLNLEMFKKGAIFDFKKVTVPAGGTTTFTVSVDSADKIFIVFFGDCDLSGSITGK